MLLSSIFLFVFFPISDSSHPSEVYLCFSYISFSAAYFYLLLFPYFLPLWSFLSVNGVFLHFFICPYASSLLVNDIWSTFSHSALLSPSSDFSLCHGVCHTLSLRDLMPLDISPEDCLYFLSGTHATFPLFSLFLLLFPHCFFLCFKCISLHHWYRQLFCPAVDSGVVLSPFANNTIKGKVGIKFSPSLPCWLFSKGHRCRERQDWVSLVVHFPMCLSVLKQTQLQVFFQ